MKVGFGFTWDEVRNMPTWQVEELTALVDERDAQHEQEMKLAEMRQRR